MAIKYLEPGALMANGELFDGEEISELVNEIINKFAERKLSVDKAEYVLNRTKELIGEYSIVNFINP